MKKTVEVSAEELNLIEKMRAKKVADEAAAAAKKIAEEKAAEAERARQEVAGKIRDKFEIELKAAHAEIETHIENARAEIRKAVAVSEKTGIPFRSDVVEFTERLYTPKSMGKKWPDVDTEMLAEDFDLYAYNNDGEPGWEYWSASSLSC